MTTAEIIAALAALPVPVAREAEEAYRRRKQALDHARREHVRLGKLLATNITRRFTRAGFSCESFMGGFIIDYRAEKDTKKQATLPHIGIRVWLTTGQRHAMERTTIEFQYLPHSGEDLNHWVRNRIAWLRSLAWNDGGRGDGDTGGGSRQKATPRDLSEATPCMSGSPSHNNAEGEDAETG